VDQYMLNMGCTISQVSSKASSDSISEILEYWFRGNRSGPATKEEFKRWYSSTPDQDNEIKEKFLSTWQDARDQKLDSWKNDRDGRLALIILIDQYSRSMHRGSKWSFELDPVAEELCMMDIDMKVDTDRPILERQFVYMPLMHSENLKAQELCVEKIEAFSEEVPAQKSNLKWAVQHHGVIKRFGRFPHRNKVLERESTKEEEEWLANPDEVPIWAGGKQKP